MGRTRVKNADLPERLFFRHSSYYYVAMIDGESVWQPLGRDRAFAVEKANELNSLKRKERLAVVGAWRSAAVKVKDAILVRDGFKCTYCGSTTDLCIDHVIPYSAGGSTLPLNIVCACASCNQSKRDRDPREFIAELMGLRELVVAEVLRILEGSRDFGRRR